jgi:hypothetical protein
MESKIQIVSATPEIQIIGVTEKKTVIDKEMIMSLELMFKNMDLYIYHMSSLWILRDILCKQANEDKHSRFFQLFDTVNGLINSLGTYGECFNEFKKRTKI